VALANHVMDTRQTRIEQASPPETRRKLQALVSAWAGHGSLQSDGGGGGCISWHTAVGALCCASCQVPVTAQPRLRTWGAPLVSLWSPAA
jgi:hypothetical protein